jgi:HAD superfamily hydrolase (TIGR01549 family)
MAYANIIFDFDGTLVDSKWDIASAQRAVLERLGVTSYAEEDLFPYVGKTLETTFSILLPRALHERIPEAARMYSEYYQPRALATTILFPGVRETLGVLREAGKRMAVASIKRSVNIKRATDHFGISSYFVQLQGSEEMPRKPDPFIVNKILKEQHWTRSDTLMVGDTDNDVFVGRNAGIATCAVTYGSLGEAELRQCSPDFVISDFAALLPIVN